MGIGWCARLAKWLARVAGETRLAMQGGLLAALVLSVGFSPFMFPEDAGTQRMVITEGRRPEVQAPREPREISRGNPALPRIALTFDCGADTQATADMLKVLEAEGVSATFFIAGQTAQANPEIVKRIAAGHELGNHSWSHPDLVSLSDAEIVAELEKTESLILTLTGRSTKPYWRAPFGSRDPRVLAAAAEAGWTDHVFWTIEAGVSGDSGDWRGLSPEMIEANILRAARLGNGVITISHCGAPATAVCLRETIRALKAMGLQPTTISGIVQK